MNTDTRIELRQRFASERRRHRSALDPTERILFFTLAAYLILNFGFSMLAIPPGIPIGEAVMILCLVWFAATKNLVSLRLRTPLLSIVVLWWLFAAVGIATAFETWGVFAFRSATHAVETGFLLLGIMIGSDPEKRRVWFRFFRVILVTGSFYALAYPFREKLSNISPQITALAGYQMPILFWFISSGLLVLTFVTHLLLRPAQSWRRWEIALALTSLATVLLLIQARANFGILALLLVIIAIFKRRKMTYLLLGSAALLLLLNVVFVSGIDLEGRIGTVTGFDFLYRQFLTSFGISVGSDLEGETQGLVQRFDWWLTIWDQLTATGWTFLFGLGQGVPLTDFGLAFDVIVREPHNSVVSTMGRYGLLGLTLFVSMHFILLRSLLRNIRASRGTVAYEEYLTLLFFVGAVLIIAMVEDALEKPHVAIPYYFVWGIAITRPSRIGYSHASVVFQQQRNVIAHDLKWPLPQ
jgi:O-antigen ligase